MGKKSVQAAEGKTTVRVLVDLYIEGRVYRPNDVVNLDDAVAAALQADGQVDSDASALAYCTAELGAEAQTHTADLPAED